ncbi:hypothetical protein EV426DRAFT_600716 [Tirmania nivea]|nr:hypothetical protein EV426DRAFT_600716 [Tirmania nivea]
MFARRRKTAPATVETTTDTPSLAPPESSEPSETTSNISSTIKFEAPPSTPNSKNDTQKSKPRLSKRRGFSMFTIGGIAGMFLAAFVGVNRDMVNLDALADIRLDVLADVIPAGILKEATDISQREKYKVPYDAFSVGLQLKNEGLKAEHPVIMIPGVISTG